MLCESCQEQEATIHIQEVVGKTTTAIHLCEVCAAEKGFGKTEAGTVGLTALLCKLTEAAADGETEEGTQQPSLTCPDCGLSEVEFRKVGRLGCSRCYAVFGPSLLPALAEVHRATRHRGKAPGAPRPPTPAADPSPAPHDPKRLEDELARAVAAEAYERAAELRDALRRIADQNEATTT